MACLSAWIQGLRTGGFGEELAPRVLGTNSPWGTGGGCCLPALNSARKHSSCFSRDCYGNLDKAFLSHVLSFTGCFPPGLKAYKSFFPACRSGGSPGPCLGRVTDKSIWSDSCLCCFPTETSLLFGFLVNWV